MIRFSKLFFGFTVFVLLLWLLPWAYNFAFYKPERTHAVELRSRRFRRG